MSSFDSLQDTIFVSGLPEDTTEKQLEEHFGAIGIIKKDKKTNSMKIWIYRDKTTGRGKGEATITYDDPPTAGSAIKWFSGKDFHGSIIKVEFAQRKAFVVPRGGGNRYGGGDRGGVPHRDRSHDRGSRDDRSHDRGSRDDRSHDRGSRDDRRSRDNRRQRPGDWACPGCNNNNFSYRTECNRCHEPKPASAQRH